jgi:putative transposase
MKHLKRLSCVWTDHPCYFITICTVNMNRLLALPQIHDILRKHWAKSLMLHGWAIGQYVIMPDHVHFFCRDAESKTKLSRMIGSWKEWTSKKLHRELNMEIPFWQREFFDHLIPSEESYSEKWNYVRDNPVRKKLVEYAEQWEFAGYIDYV